MINFFGNETNYLIVFNIEKKNLKEIKKKKLWVKTTLSFFSKPWASQKHGYQDGDKCKNPIGL
jgi:hypothetical protein